MIIFAFVLLITKKCVSPAPCGASKFQTTETLACTCASPKSQSADQSLFRSLNPLSVNSMLTIRSGVNTSHLNVTKLLTISSQSQAQGYFEFSGGTKEQTKDYCLHSQQSWSFAPVSFCGAGGPEAYCAAHDYGLLFLPLQYPSTAAWHNPHLPQILQRGRIQRRLF